MRGLSYQAKSRGPRRTDTEEAEALSLIAEQKRWKVLVAKAGIEPATHGFSVRCSTN
jgi:hypothetical protein